MTTLTERVKAAMRATETDCEGWHDEPLTEIAEAAIKAIFAGSRVMEYRGAIVIANPEFPPHMWTEMGLEEIKPVEEKDPGR